MHQIRTPTTDAAIIGRLDKPDHGDFSPEAARELLSLQLSPQDQARARSFPSRPRTERSRPTS